MRTYSMALLAAMLLAASSASAGQHGTRGAAAEKNAASKPAGQTLLKVRVEPESHVFVDGIDKGKATELELPVKPGAHIVRFVHASGDEHENRIVCEPGKITAYEWKFDYSAPTAADVQEIVIP